jgi:hypothetical protein
MDFTIALKKREIEQAAALQAKLQLQDISLYKSQAAGAGPPIKAVEPIHLSAELDSEDLQDSAGVNFAVTLRIVVDDPLVFHIEATFLARYRFVDQAKRPSKVELEAFPEEPRGSCGLALSSGIRANHRCQDGLPNRAPSASPPGSPKGLSRDPPFNIPGSKSGSANRVIEQARLRQLY